MKYPLEKDIMGQVCDLLNVDNQKVRSEYQVDYAKHDENRNVITFRARATYGAGKWRYFTLTLTETGKP